MGRAEYRLTKLTTEDFGSSKRVRAQLAHIPDGTRWDRFPQVFEVDGEGAKIGTVYVVSIEPVGG
jgi:hypothetical protein